MKNARLYVKRKENRKSQRELADALLIHPQTYHLKETGKLNFTISEALDLADYFECGLDELFAR